MSATIHLDASGAVADLRGTLDQFLYNLGVELASARSEQPALRDRFAMAALQGLISAGYYTNAPELAANKAYQVADAMMRQRTKPIDSQFAEAE